MFEESPGYVSPYPKFYRQLGQMARQAVDVLAQVTAEPDFVAAGREWLEERQLRLRKASPDRDTVSAESRQDLTTSGDSHARMSCAMAEYFRGLGKDIEAVNTLDRAKAWEALDAAAQRCAESNGVTDDDRRCMTAFSCSPWGNAAELLPVFATLCDQLATIADKEIARQPLDCKENQLIKQYGETLARFHFYEGETWMSARDDFPCIAPVFNNLMREKTLYVGVGRPEAIYVVLFNGKDLVLHRGAVLSYREFARQSGEALDDDKWRQNVDASRAPSPPAWTDSFRCAASQQERERVTAEAAARLWQDKSDVEDFPMAGHAATLARIERLLTRWQALKTSYPSTENTELSDKDWDAAEKAEEARREEEWKCARLFQVVCDYAVDEDVPDLLDKLLPVTPTDELRELGDCLERLNWTPHREKLMSLLHHPEPAIAECATVVLGSKPEDIDLALLAKSYHQQPAQVRVAYCYLIRRSQQAGLEGIDMLTAGLSDTSWEVRYQAAAAVAASRATSAKILAGVRRGFDDEHPEVAAATVHAASALGLVDTAPQMFAQLRKQIETSGLSKVNNHGFPLRLGDWEIRSLTAELIAGLGEFRYQPAKDVFRMFLFPDNPMFAEYEYDSAAFKALLRIEPERKLQLLSEIFRDSRCPDHTIQEAIVEATATNDIEYVKAMLPLFEDVGRTATEGRQGEAVWAAWHITEILEHVDLRDPEESGVFEKIHTALLRQSRGPAAGDALSALQYFDPAVAARECLSIATDKTMGRDVRCRAIAILRKAPKPWPIRELLSLAEEAPEDAEIVLSVAADAAQTVATLSRRLDPSIPREAETLELVRRTFTAMLEGPRYAVAVEGLASISDDYKDALLHIALNRSLPYETRAHALSVISRRCGPEDARKLIPVLDENEQSDEEKPATVMIVIHAANAIARMVGKEEWDSEGSSAEFVRKARSWAESAESK